LPVVRSDPIGVEHDQPEVYLSEDESESDGQDNLFERYAGDLDRQIHSDSDSDSDSPPVNAICRSMRATSEMLKRVNEIMPLV
jgi:hypothetical protein